MSDILGPFKRRAEELIDSVNSAGGLRATVEGLRTKMAESDRRRAISRARSELKRLDAQITEMITAVGVQAVGLHRAGRLAAPDLVPLCEHIVELETAVSQQRDELVRLEAAAGRGAQLEDRNCAQCGQLLPPNATFCPYCGAAAPRTGAPEQRYCADCGASLREGAKFCARCGTSVPAPLGRRRRDADKR
jgi:RNA polymerase subunit RPABC4/transcription elongation factor Spt4